METHEEWVEFHKSPGALSTAMSLDWLLQGCPFCGCKEWDVTNDGWCYCDGCAHGFPTDFIWTNEPLAHFDKNGFSCFMCHGTGKTRGGEDCEEYHYLQRGQTMTDKHLSTRE